MKPWMYGMEKRLAKILAGAGVYAFGMDGARRSPSIYTAPSRRGGRFCACAYVGGPARMLAPVAGRRDIRIYSMRSNRGRAINFHAIELTY